MVISLTNFLDKYGDSVEAFPVGIAHESEVPILGASDTEFIDGAGTMDIQLANFRVEQVDAPATW